MAQDLHAFEITQTLINKIDAPLLVIGLGGTGASGVLRIKDTFRRRFVHDKAADGTPKQDPPRTAYLVIDTDDTVKAEGWNGTKLEANSEFFSIAGNPEYLLQPNCPVINPWDRAWLDAKLSPVDVVSGGGTIRQLARLMLVKKANLLVPKLTSVMNSLLKVDASAPQGSKRINVVLIAGLCGATGSGTMLDVAYLLRYAHASHATLSQNKLDISAYVIMPDVTIDKLGNVGPRARINAYNGFAALKELDYWMNVESHKDPYVQKYSETIEQPWNTPPFDMCTLLSASKSDGTAIRNAYNIVMDVMAENLLHYMAGEARSDYVSGRKGEVNHQGADDTFGFQSARSNEYALIGQLPKRMPKRYIYRCIGAFSNVSEQRDMLNYEAMLAFEQIKLRFDKNQPQMDGTSPGEFFADIFQSSLANFMREYEQKTMWGSELFSDTGAYSMQALRETSAEDAMHGSPYRAYQRFVNEHTPQLMLEETERLKESFVKAATAAIADPKRGPGWLEMMLKHTERGILVQLQGKIEELDANYGATRNALSEQEKNIHTFYHEFTDAGFGFRKARFSAYCQNAETLFNYYQHLCFFQKWVAALNEIKAWIENYCNKNLHYFNAAINEILEDLRDKVSVVGSVAEHFVNVTKLREEISKTFHEEQTKAQLMNRIMEGIARYSFASQALGVTSDASNVLIDNLQSFISETFEAIHQQNLETMIAAYGSEQQEVISDVEEFVSSTLAPRMSRVAMAMFSPVPYYMNMPPQNVVNFCYISIPRNAPAIKAGVQKFIQTSEGYAGALVKSSDFTDRVFWMNSATGLPMCAYAPLKAYEKVYEESKRDVRGLHLVMTNQDRHYGDVRHDWRLLPSPYPYKVMGGEAPGEQADACREEIQAAIKAGLVEIKDNPFSLWVHKYPQLPAIRRSEDQDQAFRAMGAALEEVITAALALPTVPERIAALKALQASRARRAIDIENIPDKIAAYMNYMGLELDAASPEAKAACFMELSVDILSSQPMLMREIREMMPYAQKVMAGLSDMGSGELLHEARIKWAKALAEMAAFGILKIGRRIVTFHEDGGAEMGELFDDEKNLNLFAHYEVLPLHVRLAHWYKEQDVQAYPFDEFAARHEAMRREYRRMEAGDEKLAAIQQAAQKELEAIEAARTALRREAKTFVRQDMLEAMEILDTMAVVLRNL